LTWLRKKAYSPKGLHLIVVGNITLLVLIAMMARTDSLFGQMRHQKVAQAAIGADNAKPKEIPSSSAMIFLG
jgi:hypothetical protein